MPEKENKNNKESNTKDSIFEEILKNTFNANKNNRLNKSNNNLFSLEEILSILFSEKLNINIFKNKNLDEELKRKEFEEKISKLNNTSFILEEEKLSNSNIFLYEFFPNTYYVYVQKTKLEKTEKVKKQENNVYASFGYFSLFVPTGVIVRTVPQSVLGNGVLGRAFIYQNYIEILDSLVGNEYIEVLTHEVLHIMYPEKKETEIRLMTRNYLGCTVYN
ncbi:MAG: hypothetical protein QW757_04360 [Candidatus Woesearchaeota archaeon]